MKENWENLINKRILLRQKHLSTTSITEATVVEVSESGKFVKFRWENGKEVWKEPEDEYSFIYDEVLEVLGSTPEEIEAEKKSEEENNKDGKIEEPDIVSNTLTGKIESHDDNTSVLKSKVDTSSIK